MLRGCQTPANLRNFSQLCRQREIHNYRKTLSEKNCSLPHSHWVGNPPHFCILCLESIWWCESAQWWPFSSSITANFGNQQHALKVHQFSSLCGMIFVSIICANLIGNWLQNNLSIMKDLFYDVGWSVISASSKHVPDNSPGKSAVSHYRPPPSLAKLDPPCLIFASVWVSRSGLTCNEGQVHWGSWPREPLPQWPGSWWEFLLPFFSSVWALNVELSEDQVSSTVSGSWILS